MFRIQNILSQCNVGIELLRIWKLKGFLSVVIFAFAAMLFSTNHANAQLKKVEWQSGHDGDLFTIGNLSSSPDKLGYVEFSWNQGGSESVFTKAIETSPSGEKKESADTDDEDYSNNYISDIAHGGKFKGGEHLEDNNFQYGKWFLSRNYDDQGLSCESDYCWAVLFRPNVENINKLGLGDVVTSELVVTHYRGIPPSVTQVNSRKLVVTITRVGVEANWSVGVELDQEYAVLNVSSETTVTDIGGSMHAVFQKISNQPTDILKNKWEFSYFEDATPDSDDDVPEIDDNSPNTGWIYDNIFYGVEEVAELEGKETKVGSNTSDGTYGTWYIREADGYTGQRHLTHDSIRQFLFKPNLDVIEKLPAGSSVRSYLRIQTGSCIRFRVVDCSLRDSIGSIDDAVIIAATIDSSPPPVLSISGVSRTVVDNGAEFTITADSMPSEDLAINVMATSTAGNFLDSSFGASGSTVRVSDLSFSAVAGTSNYIATLNVPLVKDPNATEGSLTVELVADTSTSRKYELGSTVSHTTTILAECLPVIGKVCVSIESMPVYATSRATAGFTVTASHELGEELEVAVIGTTKTNNLACNVTISVGETTATKVCAIHASGRKIQYAIQESQDYVVVNPAVANSYYVDATNPHLKLSVDRTAVIAGESFKLSTAITPEGLYSNIAFDTEGEEWIDGTAPESFQSTSADGTAELTIQTKLRPGYGLNGEIRFAVASDSNWLLDENFKYATVAVRNLSLSVATTHKTLTAMEADTVMVKLIASTNPGEPVPVKFTPTNTTGTFLDVSSDPKYLASGMIRTESVTFALDTDGRYSALLPVKLRDNNFQPDAQGTVTVALNGFEDDANYAVGTTDNSSTITVSNIVIPIISIINPPTSVSEADEEDLTFEFSLDAQINRNVTISATITSDSTVEDEDYELGSSPQLTLSRRTSGSMTIQLTDDSIYEGDETLVVEFTATNAEFEPDVNTHKLTVIIQDDESKPEISFKSFRDGEIEGNSLDIALVATVRSEKPLSIGYFPTESKGGDFLLPSFKPDVTGEKLMNSPELTFALNESSNKIEAEFSIPVRPANGKIDSNGEISLVLAPPDGSAPYTIDNSKKTTTVTIIDEYSLPTISVSGPSNPVLEADGATLTYDFNLSERPAGHTYGTISIWFKVSTDSTVEADDYIISTYSTAKFVDDKNQIQQHTISTDCTEESIDYFLGCESRLTIPAVRYLRCPVRSDTCNDANDKFISATLVIEIVNDKVYEGDETIVLDFSATNAIFSSRSFKHTLTGMIADNEEKPVLSIESTTQTVSEGDTAIISVKSNIGVENALSVGYTATNTSGDFLDADSGDSNIASINFEPIGSAFIGELMIPTKKSENEDPDPGEITVVLTNPQSTDEYTIDNSAKTASIRVVKDSTPVISLSSSKRAIMEGVDIEIVLKATPIPTKEIDVRLRVTQNGDNLIWPVKNKVRFNSGLNTVGLKLSTIGNPNTSDSGVVSVEVIDGEGYKSGNSITIEVLKPDESTEETTKYSVVSAVISKILNELPPSPLRGDSRVTKPTVSVKAVKETVEEGEPAVFTIATLQAVNSGFPIRINLTQSGDFIIGPLDRSVDLRTDRSETELLVRTNDDELAGLDGRITATIQDGSKYLVGSESTAHVIVSDELDRQNRNTLVSNAMHAVLPDLFAHSTTRLFGITEERIKQAFNGSPATSIELNGKSSIKSMLQFGGEVLNDSNTDWRSIIDGSSFTVALYPDGGETSPATVWGVGDQWRLSSDRNDGQHWEGETYSGHFGFDARVGQALLAGLIISKSQSEIGYGRTEDTDMSFDSIATALHPFLGFSAPDGKSRMQILAGYGENELLLKQKEYSPEVLNGQFHTFGLGGNYRLYSNDNLGGLHNLELSVAGDGWHSVQSVNSAEGVVDDLRMNVRHIRISFEETHDHYPRFGGKISPTISLGMREDLRNEKNVYGLEVGSGFRYDAFDGLEVMGSGKSMLSGFNRMYWWEIENSLDFDPGNDGKNLLLGLSSSWSGTDSNVERFIWGSELVNDSNDIIGSHDGSNIGIKLGYGIEILDGSSVMTPYSEFNQKDGHGSEVQVGSRLKTDTGFDFELEAVRNVPETGPVAHEYKLSGNISW